MPVVTKYICDGCGKEKGVCNHWFMRQPTYPQYIQFSEWMNDQSEATEMYCGEACVLAAISKWMQERKEQDTETGKG